MSLMSILVTLGLACVASVNAWHRVCDGGIEPDPKYLATSNDKGPLETAVQRTDSRYWWDKDGSFEPDEQVELIAPVNEDGVDTVIKLCRPWDEGGCAKCPAILAFDDNASKLVNGVYYYSKLPTLDWLYANGYTPADLRRDPNRPDRFKICVRSYWVESPEVCSGDLHEDCRGYFRATCRKTPLPGGGPDGPIFDNGDPARNGNRKLL